MSTQKKIAVIGSTGTIGNAVTNKLTNLGHDVVEVSYNKSKYKIDLCNLDSVKNFYTSVGNLDAVVVTMGKVNFAHFTDMTHDKYLLGLQNKLMGAVNLVLEGTKYLKPGGVFTLTSGIINRQPIKHGTSPAMVNGALEAFVKSAALELPNNLRINIVSPSILLDSYEKYQDYFMGFEPVSSDRVANAYIKSIMGIQTGQVFCVD